MSTKNNHNVRKIKTIEDSINALATQIQALKAELDLLKKKIDKKEAA